VKAARRAEKTKKTKRRHLWARLLYDQYKKSLNEFTAKDGSGYKNFLRIDPATVPEILARVGPRTEKKDTFWKKALEPGLKLLCKQPHHQTAARVVLLSFVVQNFIVSVPFGYILLLQFREEQRLLLPLLASNTRCCAPCLSDGFTGRSSGL